MVSWERFKMTFAFDLLQSVYIMGVPKTSTWEDQRVWHNEFGELSREAEAHRDMVLIDYIEDYNNIRWNVVPLKNGSVDFFIFFEKFEQIQTRRERPKSAPYPRLENFQGTTIGNIWEKLFSLYI